MARRLRSTAQAQPGQNVHRAVPVILDGLDLNLSATHICLVCTAGWWRPRVRLETSRSGCKSATGDENSTSEQEARWLSQRLGAGGVGAVEDLAGTHVVSSVGGRVWCCVDRQTVVAVIVVVFVTRVGCR